VDSLKQSVVEYSALGVPASTLVLVYAWFGSGLILWFSPW
jgi:hypothetical protein